METLAYVLLAAATVAALYLYVAEEMTRRRRPRPVALEETDAPAAPGGPQDDPPGFPPDGPRAGVRRRSILLNRTPAPQAASTCRCARRAAPTAAFSWTGAAARRTTGAPTATLPPRTRILSPRGYVSSYRIAAAPRPRDAAIPRRRVAATGAIVSRGD